MRELWLELTGAMWGVQNICVFTKYLNSSAPDLDYRRKEQSYLYGTEYRMSDGATFTNVANHDAPCAVAISYAPTRIAKITIPGRISCPFYGLGSTTATSWLTDIM